MDDDVAVFEELRPLLFSIAYRMLGAVGDAEDMVQEAFLRYRHAQDEGARIDSPKAYLSAVVTRLAIDELRSARARRETYLGHWLPEPLPTGERDDDPAARAEQSDTLSMAFLLALERLTPVERAVFLLHDVFDYAYDEIAPIVERTPANCRQLAVRARRGIEALNGAPGALVVDGDGRITNVFVLELDRDAVRTVRSVINPDKLGHLGPVADVLAMVRRDRRT